MPLFIAERDHEGAGDLSPDDLARMAQAANVAAASLGEPYTWVRSYVAGDRIFGVHEAQDAEAVVEHSRRAGLAVHVVTQVVALVDPTTAGAAADVTPRHR
jgi:hypothetical protein